jgi:hypothetical protein
MEPHYEQHCDDPPCDLGLFRCECPHCGKVTDDFDGAWWERDKIDAGASVASKCEHCKKTFFVSRVDDEYVVVIG